MKWSTANYKNKRFLSFLTVFRINIDEMNEALFLLITYASRS